jgi:hypothetical protein
MPQRRELESFSVGRAPSCGQPVDVALVWKPPDPTDAAHN